jgi:low affinity Fe/Cu permease
LAGLVIAQRITRSIRFEEGIVGPAFYYSDTWQLIINTGTTIGTFLRVFLIQNTQNRDAKAAHLKLEGSNSSAERARNELIDLKKLADEDLTSLERQFERVRKKAERNGNNPGGNIRANRFQRVSQGEGHLGAPPNFASTRKD